MVNTQDKNSSQAKYSIECREEIVRNSTCVAYIAPVICMTLMTSSMGIVHNLYA